jgi:hypothetical protein
LPDERLLANVGWILFQGRRYDDSIRELRSFLAVHPDDAMAHLTLAFPIIANGQAPEAISDLEKDGGHDAS